MTLRSRSGLAAFNTATLMPWLGHLATVVALTVLAWLCATIYWSITTTSGTAIARSIDTNPQHTVQTLVSRHLFGVSTAPASLAASTPSDLRLNGVIAAQSEGQPAYALIVVEGKPAQVIREGAEVAPGITLKRVLAREVELLRNGQPQTLSLPQAQPQTPTPALMSTPTPPPPQFQPPPQPSPNRGLAPKP